ncbi:phage tail protein (plasmid) [Bacillus thuringiensis]|uniref:phage tail spike protein n=1 Tax=Bacillus thuringiensis TaxID=1428 RepID=UPI003D709EE1
MIIVVDKYNKQKTILTNSAPKAPQYFKDNHFESLDGVLTYEFEVRADDKATAHLVAGHSVIVRDLDKRLLKFTILRTHESRNSDGVYVRKIFAENSAVGDLIGHVVTGKKLIATNAKQAGTYVLQGTGWQVGSVDAIGLADVDLSDYPTGLAGLHKIREAFDLELEFTIHWDGQRILAQYVHFVKKRGSRTGKRFTHGKDLIGVTREEDRSDMCTALVPVGKADEEGNRLTLGGHDNHYEGWVSPKDQIWIGDNQALQQFGVGGKHIFGRVEFSNIDDIYNLMKAGVEELKKRNKPRMTYEMTVALLERLAGFEHEKVRLGDYVLVKDTGFEPYLAVDARVISINRSYTDPSQDKVVLGEFIPVIIEPNKQIEAIQNQINSNMSKWEAKGETVYKSKIAPIKSKRFPDMLWLDTAREPNIMKRWDAEAEKWVKASATEASEVGAETPDGALAKAKEAEEKAVETAEKDATQKKAEAILEANEYTNEVVVEAMEETVIKTKSYVDGLVPEIEAELQKHADAVAKDAEDNAKLYTERYSEKAMHVDSTPPADTTKLWMDTTKRPFVLKKHNGKEWVSASPQVPADIGAPDINDVMTKANEARDSAIESAKKDAETKANKARTDAIAEAKKLDESIKTEAERIAKQAEANANAHTSEVTKLVEEALKLDAQDKANTAEKNAVDKALQNAKTEAEKARQSAEKNAKAEAEKFAKEMKAQADAEAKKLADEAKRLATEDAKKLAEQAEKNAKGEAQKIVDNLSVSGTNLLLGTKDKVHEVVNGANKPHTYFTFVPNATKDIQGQDITLSLRLSGKIGTLGTTNAWIGMEVRIDFEDGTASYVSARFEKQIKVNTQYDRQLVVGTAKVMDKPIKSLSAYSLARDFTGGTIRMEEFKVGIGTMFSGYDRPEVEVLEEVRATIGSASGQNLALNSAGKLGWIGWSATQTTPDKWTITNTELNGFTKTFRITNTQVSTAENFLINTIPVANIRILGQKVQFGGWVFTKSMTTGGIRFYMRARGKDKDGKEIMKYANAGAQNDIRGRGWEWITFEFSDWDGMVNLDEVRITANCLKGSNGEACVTGVMMKVSEVSSQWTPSPLDFEELASDAGILTKGTLAAERLYGQTIDGNKANFVNLNASNISTGTLNAERIGANAINASRLQAGSVIADKIATNAVTADKIIAGAVNASKLSANAVVADKIASNAVTTDKISANAVNASKIVAGAINGNHITANAVNANHITAGAITAEKLHVLAKSLVANTSLTGNDSLGWAVNKHATSTNQLRGSVNMGDVLVHGFTTADHDTPTQYNSNYFEVDPNQSYKFSIGMFVEKNEREGSQYFGLNAYDKNGKELPMQPLNPTNGALSGDPRTNPYFWSGMGTIGRWQFMEGYVVSSQSGGNEAPQGRNIQSSYRMHPATKFLRMRFYSGYYPKAKNKEASILWHSPSVTAVDSGTLVAERIVAGTLDANKVNVTNLKANNITSGTMTADRINGGTINANNTNIINLKAGNITSGTIDASKISVINMNAGNISTGMLNVGGTQIAKGTDFMQKGWKPLRASIAHSINENYLITGGAQAKEEFVYLPRFDLNGGGGEKVTLAFEYNVDSNYVALPEIFLLASKSTTEALIDSVNHDYVHVLTGGESPVDIGGNWKRVTKTFTLQNDIKSAVLRLDHNGSKDGKNCNYRYRRVMLNYGSIALTWSPHTEESIGIGAITADKIRAGAITTNKLTVGDFTNLVPNNAFINGTLDEWDRGTVVGSTTAGVPAGAPTNYVRTQTERDTYVGDWFAVKTGDRFYCELTAATANSGVPISLGLHYVDKDNKPYWSVFTPRINPTGGKWVTQGGEIHLSIANATKARVFVQVDGTTGSTFGTWYMTNAKIHRKTDANLIVDGSVIASKIATNAVTADKIVAGAINASKISANAIDASKIASNAVTTDKLSANAVNASKIQAGAITADKIATNAISASMIQTGTLDASKVTINNLTANRITGGTMSADRISGGTINANTTNIINLKAQNIASGKINADNVEISNGRVTIGKTGVQVTEADFLVKNAKTGFTHSLEAQSNLIGDHSFEMLSADGDIWQQCYRYINWEFITENDAYGKWARVGSPRMIDGYNTDVPEGSSAFGRKAVLVNSGAYVYQDIDAKANKKYTVSFHASKPFFIGAGAPQVQVEYVKNGSVVSSEVKNFAVPATPAGEYVRYGFTVTAPATLNHERSNRIRLRFRVNGAEHVLIDGVQAVQGDKAVPYDAEDSLWAMSNARLSPVRMHLRNLMMQGNTRVEGGGLSIAGRNANGVGLEMSERLRIWGDNPLEVRQSHVEATAFRCIGSRPAGTDRMLWLGWHDQAGNALYGFIGGAWKVITRL